MEGGVLAIGICKGSWVVQAGSLRWELLCSILPVLEILLEPRTLILSNLAWEKGIYANQNRLRSFHCKRFWRRCLLIQASYFKIKIGYTFCFKKRQGNVKLDLYYLFLLLNYNIYIKVYSSLKKVNIFLWQSPEKQNSYWFLAHKFLVLPSIQQVTLKNCMCLEPNSS